MAGGALQGMKLYVINHPPLVIFTMCIFIFGITTIVLAFIVGKSDLPNPDITMDWNVFLSHLSQRSLCVQVGNLSQYHKHSWNGVSPKKQGGNTSVASSSEPLMGVEELSLSELLPDISSFKLGQVQRGPVINVTKSLVVPLTFDSGLKKLPPIVTWLSGSVTGRHLGYTGQLSKEIVHVNIFLPNKKPKGYVRSESCPDETNCETRLKVCMVFFGSSSVMPKTRQQPGCRHWSNDVKRSANTTWYLPEVAQQRCTASGKTQLRIQYQSDPSLTVMLSPLDRSLVNLHLMHTSYLIFIVVVSMLCYTLVRNHFRTAKALTSEKINV